MIDVSKLNKNQLEAFNWGEGSLLVLAGPGSGKTRVLTFRIARLIDTTPDEHFKILGLTFTNSAAAEMRERIITLVPNAGKRTLLTTFHLFAADILRQHGHHLGLKPDFIILSQDADRHSLLDEAIERTKADIEKSSESLLPLISRLIEKDISPEKAFEMLQRSSFEDAEALASVYENYRSLMIKRNTLDFPGLIAEALGLLKGHSGIRKQIQQIYPYICVDEFQDTSLSQYKILCQLVNKETKNLFVVADDDQIIYQWTGASPERLKDIQKEFDMDVLQLVENHRCPPTVASLANNLIAYNLNQYSAKGMRATRGSMPENSGVVLERFSQFPDEADWVAGSIANRPKQERAKCAVLARTRKLLENVIESLKEHEVEGYLATRKSEFESVPLQWFHSILRLANSRNNREHLRRACKSFFMLEGIELDAKDITSYSSAKDGDYLRGWAEAALSREEISDETRKLIENSLVPTLLERLDFRNFQEDAFKWLDALPNITPDDENVFDEYPDEKETWRRLVEEISMQHGEGGVSLHLLLQEMDLRSKSPVPPKDAVPCFTIHASKGMEFDHVYLVGLVEDQLPSWAAKKRGEDSLQMQEERRNCFVAITRTQKTLTMTYSDEVQGWSKQPSRFLYEMGILNVSQSRQSPPVYESDTRNLKSQ